MRRVLLAVTCAVILTTLSLGVASPASAKQGALSGTWTSIDTDGSSQQLDIMGSGTRTYAMVLFDESATICGGSPAMVVGPGSVDGDGVQMSATVTCLPGGNPVRGRITLGFVYSPGTDSLTDETGVIWHRS